MSTVVTGLLVAIAAGFWFVQIVHGEYYRELAENNRLRKLPIEAPRGLIYDRNGRLLVENVPSYNLMLDRSRTADLDRSLAFAAQVLRRPAARAPGLLAGYRAVPEFKPVLLAENLTLSQVARIGVAGLEYPEFEVEVQHLRLYRHGEQTAHVLGYLGEATEAEIAAANGAYSPATWWGRRGSSRPTTPSCAAATASAWWSSTAAAGRSRSSAIERAAGQGPHPDDRPRPAAGGGALVRRAGEGGRGGGHRPAQRRGPGPGLVAVLQPQPLRPPAAQGGLAGPARRPQPAAQNRAIQNTYSPGSVFKIVMATAGLTEQVVNEHSRVFCPGAAVIYGRRFRCWSPGGHGSVDARRALKHSCDVYFYHLGKKLGIERIAHYARLFGLEVPTGIDLSGEKPGLVPDAAWSLRARKAKWYPGETISVAIGQGPMLLTPLQMAVMTAMAANGGHPVTPHLVKGAQRRTRPDVPLDPHALKVVREGLWAVVNSPGGTAHWSACVPGIDMAGKTGTVQVVAQSARTKSESLPFRFRDHAWFSCFAPVGDPRLVVVVFAEHGGAGSRTAAPIGKAVHEKYFAPDLQRAAAR